MEFKTVKIVKPDDINIIIGQSHFIKTVEDIYETVICAVPNIKFGLGFCESSGECLVRVDGNDEDLKKIAQTNALNIGAGHIFVLAIKNAYPINILPVLRNIPEICAIYCASANPVEVIIAETAQGRGIMGVIDGSAPKGVENQSGIKWRKEFLRKIGYKL